MVVETIDFYADEDAELPPPMSQRDVVALNNAAALEDEAPADAAAETGNGQARPPHGQPQDCAWPAAVGCWLVRVGLLHRELLCRGCQ